MTKVEDEHVLRALAKLEDERPLPVRPDDGPRRALGRAELELVVLDTAAERCETLSGIQILWPEEIRALYAAKDVQSMALHELRDEVRELRRENASLRREARVKRRSHDHDDLHARASAWSTHFSLSVSFSTVGRSIYIKIQYVQYLVRSRQVGLTNTVGLPNSVGLPAAAQRTHRCRRSITPTLSSHLPALDSNDTLHHWHEPKAKAGHRTMYSKRCSSSCTSKSSPPAVSGLMLAQQPVSQQQAADGLVFPALARVLERRA